VTGKKEFKANGGRIEGVNILVYMFTAQGSIALDEVEKESVVNSRGPKWRLSLENENLF